jgi:hypothetical protein
MSSFHQLIFDANWNVRGSSAAVGWPAWQADGSAGPQTGFMSPTLNRLKRLNASVMTSAFHLSRSCSAGLRPASFAAPFPRQGRRRAAQGFLSLHFAILNKSGYAFTEGNVACPEPSGGKAH